MKTLTEYFTETPIRDDFDSLCDSDLSCETDRTQVNELVLNFVIKYLALYLGVEHAHIAEMRERICELVDEAYEDDKLYNPFLTGVQVDHIYGNDPGVDYFPLSCIADIRQTAAIFKEIMFNKGFTASDTFTGLDFGSGTGILLIAMLIAAKRNAIQEICCKGIEIREMTAGKSRSAISHLMQGDDSNIEIIHQNIFRGDFLGQLLKKFPPNYIVSETISRITYRF